MKIANLKLRGLSSLKLKTRSGLKDVWNAKMAEGAIFCDFDIPFCPTTAKNVPTSLITWDDAKTTYRLMKKQGMTNFHHEAFVCFYIDDVKFDGPGGIWYRSDEALDILKHFAGVITPDFSTYQDFPEAIKIYATYRMRLFGYWLGRQGIGVINNVRWGTAESYRYCFSGIPRNSMLAIGTVGGNPRRLADRERFVCGLEEMVKVLQPKIIVVYGSSNYKCFDAVRESGISVVSFTGKTAMAFMRRKKHEQT